MTELGGELSFVKPHGALYNDMARDAELTSLVVTTIKAFDPTLKIMGLAGSHCSAICENLAMPFLGEAFADRRYADDGQLSPRSQDGAVITEPETAVEQIMSSLSRRESNLSTVSGYHCKLKAFASTAIHRVR